MDLKYVKLSDILKEIYEEKNNGVNFGTNADLNFNNFKKDYTKKLKKITKGLGIDISNYMDEKNGYKIPEIIADIFKLYLQEESSKGSFVSKIINNKMEKITVEEKKEFLKKTVNELKKNNKYNNDELDNFYKSNLIDIEYNDKVVKKISETKNRINKIIENELKKLTQISDIDGMIIVNDSIKKGVPSVEYNNREAYTSVDVLSYSDRLTFIEYLDDMINQTFEQWHRLIAIANEIKNAEIDDIVENDFNNEINKNEEVISRYRLLREAIKDYNSELKRKYTSNVNIDENSLKEFEEMSIERKKQIM